MITPEILGLKKVAYSVKEVEEMLSMSHTTVYEEVRRGRLKKSKIGRKTLFMAIDLAVYVSNLIEAR